MYLYLLLWHDALLELMEAGNKAMVASVKDLLESIAAVASDTINFSDPDEIQDALDLIRLDLDKAQQLNEAALVQKYEESKS